MKSAIISVLVLALAAGPAPVLWAQDKVGESEYYPLKVGNTWDMKVGDVKITNKVVKHEKIGDLMCALIETSKDGKVIAREHIAIKEDGIYRVTGNDQKAEPELCFLKLPPKTKPGESWDVESKIGSQTLKGKFTLGEEELTVNNTKYKALVAESKDFQVSGLDLTTKTWFAPNVGIVKQIVNIGGKEVKLELEKYELAK
jgi:hypothetical protein